MTSDEQSVSAMMPMRTSGVSGASDAYTSPAQPCGNPASSRASPVCPVRVRKARRVGCGMASCCAVPCVTTASSAMSCLSSVPESTRLNLICREQGMCQNVSCYPLKHLCPSCLQAFPSFPGEGRPADLTRFVLHLCSFLGCNRQKSRLQASSSRGGIAKATPGVGYPSSVCRYLGDFRKRFSTPLYTRSPASHPVREGGTSPQRGEARSVSTPPWTTTREVLFMKSPYLSAFLMEATKMYFLSRQQ